ncbi:MAG TPA: hypothetical protein VH437_13055 [Terriglobales bacterium]|jgi:hypothetical protein
MPEATSRPWRQIALELCLQTSPKKIIALTAELDEALKQQHFGEIPEEPAPATSSGPKGLTKREARKSRVPSIAQKAYRQMAEDVMLAREMRRLSHEMLEYARLQRQRIRD